MIAFMEENRIRVGVVAEILTKKRVRVFEFEQKEDRREDRRMSRRPN